MHKGIIHPAVDETHNFIYSILNTNQFENKNQLALFVLGTSSWLYIISTKNESHEIHHFYVTPKEAGIESTAITSKSMLTQYCSTIREKTKNAFLVKKARINDENLCTIIDDLNGPTATPLSQQMILDAVLLVNCGTDNVLLESVVQTSSHCQCCVS